MRVRPIPLFLPGNNALRQIDNHVLNAKMALKQLRKDKTLEHIDSAILVYQISDGARSYKGLVLGVDIADFLEGHIINHENTIPDKVNHQASIAFDQDGFAKPILLTHKPIQHIQNLIDRVTTKPPHADIFLSKYQTQHKIWIISELEDIQLIQKQFEKKNELYIVDGHHRTAALIKLAANESLQIKYGMCALFDIEQLQILPFHRILKVDSAFSAPSFLEAIRQFGTIELLKNAKVPDTRHQLILMIGKQIFMFQWSEQVILEHNGSYALDVNLLNELILKQTLNISEKDMSSKLEFIEGNIPLDTIQSMVVNSSKIAVLLHPISIQNLIDITDAGKILPPKSTWFLPRLANGIVTNRLTK